MVYPCGKKKKMEKAILKKRNNHVLVKGSKNFSSYESIKNLRRANNKTTKEKGGDTANES